VRSLTLCELTSNDLGQPPIGCYRLMVRAEQSVAFLLLACQPPPGSSACAVAWRSRPHPVVLDRLNGRDGRVKPVPPIRRGLDTLDHATQATIPGQLGLLRGAGGSGREAGLTWAARPLIIGEDGTGTLHRTHQPVRTPAARIHSRATFESCQREVPWPLIPLLTSVGP